MSRHRELADQVAIQSAQIASLVERQAEYDLYEAEAEVQEDEDWGWSQEEWYSEDAQEEASHHGSLSAFPPEVQGGRRTTDLDGHGGCDGHVGTIAGYPVSCHQGSASSGPVIQSAAPNQLPTVVDMSGPVPKSADIHSEWPAAGLNLQTGVATRAAPAHHNTGAVREVEGTDGMVMTAPGLPGPAGGILALPPPGVRPSQDPTSQHFFADSSSYPAYVQRPLCVDRSRLGQSGPFVPGYRGIFQFIL